MAAQIYCNKPDLPQIFFFFYNTFGVKYSFVTYVYIRIIIISFICHLIILVNGQAKILGFYLVVIVILVMRVDVYSNSNSNLFLVRNIVKEKILFKNLNPASNFVSIIFEGLAIFTQHYLFI